MSCLDHHPGDIQYALGSIMGKLKYRAQENEIGILVFCHMDKIHSIFQVL